MNPPQGDVLGLFGTQYDAVNRQFDQAELVVMQWGKYFGIDLGRGIPALETFDHPQVMGISIKHALILRGLRQIEGPVNQYTIARHQILRRTRAEPKANDTELRHYSSPLVRG
jgi:hypothetical protein